jgi:hypothetical protein
MVHEVTFENDEIAQCACGWNVESWSALDRDRAMQLHFAVERAAARQVED